jgi:flagellar basal body-associated protein FliL
METGARFHLILMIFLTPISFGAMTLVVWWFITQKDETAQARNVDAIWSRRKMWGDSVCRRLLEGKIDTGMTSEMVRLAWGEPTEIEELENGQTRWNYQHGKKQKRVGSVTFHQGQAVSHYNEQLISSANNTVWIYIAILLILSLVVSAITLAIVFWPVG